MTFDDLSAARERIAAYIHRTPVFTSRLMNDWLGCEAHFKCEQLQRAGAFKFRGACHAVMGLSDGAARRGVVTHSSGNHGAALALAASLRGIPVHVVMPVNAPAVKRAAVAAYGGRIWPCEPTQAAREATCAAVIEETGGTLVHPYDDHRIIAGQATAAWELHEDVPGLDVIVVPVGGGGLAAGTALVTHAVNPRCRVMLGEPERADDAFRSLQAGRILPVERTDTVADGLRTSLGERTFPVIQRHVARIITVNEEAIIEALRMLWTRMKLIVEPSSAVPVAAIRAAGASLAGQRVGVILSGGNVDLDALPWSVSDSARPAASKVAE
jgi:threonine dehydratase